MTRKEKKKEFDNQLSNFVNSLKTAIITQDGQWTIKGFIDVYKNIYTISSDTKIVSKILMSKVFVPPIKCQGIKTKLVPLIREMVTWDNNGRWIEPFTGSGVVGFNIRPKQAIFSDSNPHTIHFYQAINEKRITPSLVKQHLVQEGKLLSQRGKTYYYEVRSRFNQTHDPLDFLFLNRACFNGMIRFNQSGGFNVPFNHKPNRFSPAYITKVVNQVKYVYDLCQTNDYNFICQDFRETLTLVEKHDFVYCDPPYAGRHVDYYNSWSTEDEAILLDCLAQFEGKFVLSTWHSNQYRHNPLIEQLQRDYHIITRQHFYHVGAKESNRNAILEALVMNYPPARGHTQPQKQYQQARLLEAQETYTPTLKYGEYGS